MSNQFLIRYGAARGLARAFGVHRSPGALDGSATNARDATHTEGGRGLLQLVYDDPQMSDVDPVPLAPQPQPRARASVLAANRTTGLIFCNSVFNTDQPFDQKAVRYVRVLEGVQMGQSIAANAAFRTRILGTVALHPDGSFFVEVPANVPLRFELLDADGRMRIHETEFNSVRPGETKGCTGCHENRKETSPNFRPLALGDAPVA